VRSLTPGDRMPSISMAWSPFSLVQACRLHSMQADLCQPLMRLFKVSIFHHGLTHFFATQGEKADMERARWVADVSRTLRILTQSLFPPFYIRTNPHPGASWTGTRLLAGYLLLYDELGVSRVFGELHAHWDNAAAFAAYEDDCCDVQIVHLTIDMATCVSDRVGIDCSCFSLGDHHFSARSCAEKMLWLRAISNVKVKLRHWAANPTRTELRHYRTAIWEHAQSLPHPPAQDASSGHGPLLPRRSNLPVMKAPICSGIENDRTAASPRSDIVAPTSPGVGFGVGIGAGISSISAVGCGAGIAGPGGGNHCANGTAGTSTALMAAAAARLSQTQSQRPQAMNGFDVESPDDGLPPSAGVPDAVPKGEHTVPFVKRAELMTLLGPDV